MPRRGGYFGGWQPAECLWCPTPVSGAIRLRCRSPTPWPSYSDCRSSRSCPRRKWNASRGDLSAEHFGIGAVVCRAGDPADCLYLVYSGRARVVTRANEAAITVGTLSRGDHFGEQALLTGGTRAFTVRAADDLVLLRLSPAAFHAVLARRPELQDYFDRHLADLATRNFLRLCSTFRVLRRGDPVAP